MRGRRPIERRVPAHRRGFTLIEVVLSMFLLLVGSTAILAMLSFGAGTARTAGLRSEATAALPAVLLELEETLFPLVLDEDGFEQAGEPIPARSGLPVPGHEALTYAYQTTPVPTPDGAPALEYVVDVTIAWREGGNERTVTHTTLLLREVPFGERLRQRFVEGREPLTLQEHEAALARARAAAETPSETSP